MKNNMFKENIAPVLVLVCICLVVTAALAGLNSVTAPIIEANAIAEANAARTELLPEADDFTIFNGELAVLEEGKVFVTDCYTANNGTGMVVTVKTKSFGGLLTEMIGLDANGAITGVKVTAHGDTPGLGTKAHDAGYLAQYAGLTEYTNFSAKADAGVTHVTGATVSSDAVHYGVCAALEQYKLVGGAN
jgi:electron transport complex protein RnfG